MKSEQDLIIGLVQASPGMENAEYFIKEAKEQGCQILCFPEAFLTGYDTKNVKNLSLSVEDEKIQKIASWAKEYALIILMGFMEKKKEHFYITHGIFETDGAVQFYQKTHLGEIEGKVITPGNILPVYSLSCGLKIGFQICTESHFPEITQILSLKRAEIVFAPFAVPGTVEKRKEVWSKIIPARSYDNRVYMACCNIWDGYHFYGGSMVTDSNGEVIAERFENSPGLLTFKYEKRRIQEFHEGNPSMKYRYYPAKRRPELYK